MSLTPSWFPCLFDAVARGRVRADYLLTDGNYGPVGQGGPACLEDYLGEANLLQTGDTGAWQRGLVRMESPGTWRWSEGDPDEVRRQKKRGAHHLGRMSPTSEAATVDTVGLWRFERRTVAELAAGGRGCRRYVDSVGDVHTPAVLDLQTAPLV